jgi:hypothetical protein
LAWDGDPAKGEILGIPGATSSSIDEKGNVLVFGFVDPRISKRCVEAVLQRNRANDAYRIEQENPISLR